RNASSLRKAELVDLLAEKIPEQIKQTCMLLDEAPFDLLMTLAQNGGQANAEKITHAEAEAWRQTGLLFTGTIEGQRKLLMPQDLVNPVLELSTDREVKASVKRNREWIQLTKGLLYYYGTLSKEDLVKKVTEL